MLPLDWLSEDRTRASTAEDLRSVVACWTRVEIILGLSGPVRNLAAFAAMLVKSASLLGNHLRVLRSAGLVCRARQGKDHFHALTDAAGVEWLPDGVRLVLRADDETGVDWVIRYTAAIMRILGGGLAAAGHPLQQALSHNGRSARPAPPQSIPAFSTPGTPARARKSPHLPNGRG